MRGWKVVTNALFRLTGLGAMEFVFSLPRQETNSLLRANSFYLTLEIYSLGNLPTEGNSSEAKPG
jgi:hypothetical protein